MGLARAGRPKFTKFTLVHSLRNRVTFGVTVLEVPFDAWGFAPAGRPKFTKFTLARRLRVMRFYLSKSWGRSDPAARSQSAGV